VAGNGAPAMESEFSEILRNIFAKAQRCLQKRRDNVVAEHSPLTPQSRENMLSEVQGCLRRIALVATEVIANFSDHLEQHLTSSHAPHRRLAEIVRALPALCDEICERLASIIRGLTLREDEPKLIGLVLAEIDEFRNALDASQ
jgi:hypothetical protein